jgi:hypothetical protein
MEVCYSDLPLFVAEEIPPYGRQKEGRQLRCGDFWTPDIEAIGRVQACGVRKMTAGLFGIITVEPRKLNLRLRG